MNDQNDPPTFSVHLHKNRLETFATVSHLPAIKYLPNYYITNDPSVLIGVRGKEQDSVPLPTYFCSKGLLRRYVLKHRWKF